MVHGLQFYFQLFSDVYKLIYAYEQIHGTIILLHIVTIILNGFTANGYIGHKSTFPACCCYIFDQPIIFFPYITIIYKGFINWPRREEAPYAISEQQQKKTKTKRLACAVNAV